MKKIMMLSMAAVVAVSLFSCGNNSEDKGFQPRLNPEADVKLEVRGHYSNFEALENEVKLFQKY